MNNEQLTDIGMGNIPKGISHFLEDCTKSKHILSHQATAINQKSITMSM